MPVGLVERDAEAVDLVSGEGRGLLLVLEAEADLDPDLEVLDLAVLDLATDLGDLEPVTVPQRLGGPLHAVVDRLLEPLGRGAYDLGDAVGAVGHARASLVELGG